jgi:hypothetical protein
MPRTQNHSLAKSCKTQKNSQMKSPKDAKKYEETQITRIPHRRRPKKILKKNGKMQQV